MNCLYVYIRPLLLKPPSHHSLIRPFQIITEHFAELPVYTAASHQLAPSHVVVDACRSYSPTLPHPLLPSYVHMLFLTYASLFLPCKYIPLYHFSRVYIYVLIKDTCFSLSDLLHSIWQILDLATSLQMAQFHPFLWLSNIPLHRYTTTSLSIHLLIATVTILSVQLSGINHDHNLVQPTVLSNSKSFSSVQTNFVSIEQ